MRVWCGVCVSKCMCSSLWNSEIVDGQNKKRTMAYHETWSRERVFPAAKEKNYVWQYNPGDGFFGPEGGGTRSLRSSPLWDRQVESMMCIRYLSFYPKQSFSWRRLRLGSKQV